MQLVFLVYPGTTPMPKTAAWETRTTEPQQAIYADYGAFNDTEGVVAGLPLGCLNSPVP